MVSPLLVALILIILLTGLPSFVMGIVGSQLLINDSFVVQFKGLIHFKHKLSPPIDKLGLLWRRLFIILALLVLNARLKLLYL
jgi:hypothetical protein